MLEPIMARKVGFMVTKDDTGKEKTLEEARKEHLAELEEIIKDAIISSDYHKELEKKKGAPKHKGLFKEEEERLVSELQFLREELGKCQTVRAMDRKRLNYYDTYLIHF